MNSHELKIEFPNEELKDLFYGWMIDGGGSDMFMDLAEDGKSMKLSFRIYEENPDYPKTDPRRYSRFPNDTIKVVIREDE